MLIADNIIIYVNKNMSDYSKRFMICYMYCYHKLYTTEDTFHHIFYDESIYDKKAYFNALKLLVPIDMLKEDINNNISMDELSKKYKLSSNVLLERLKLDNRGKQKQKFKVLKK